MTGFTSFSTSAGVYTWRSFALSLAGVLLNDNQIDFFIKKLVIGSKVMEEWQYLMKYVAGPTSPLMLIWNSMLQACS